MRRGLMLMLGSMVAFACTKADEQSPMPEMTAEEHAQMLAGGTSYNFV